MDSSGFWNTNFDPQKLQQARQGAQQWGQGVQSALTDRSAMQDPSQYGKNLLIALLGGEQGLSMLPQQAQQRMQDWMGSSASSSGAPASTTPLGAAETPQGGIYQIPGRQQAMTALQGALSTPQASSYQAPNYQQALGALQKASGGNPFAAIQNKFVR